MSKDYDSKFYTSPIKVDNIDGEIIVTIIDSKGKEIIYTWYDIIEQNTESTYINKCLLGGLIKGIPKNVLIIGFGGGAFAKYIEDNIYDVNITGIDIDETMIKIAKEEVGVKTNDIYISDAAKALNIINEKGLKYDLVLIDVYGSNGEVPDYFKDIEFFENIKKISNKNTVISINYSDYSLNKTKYDTIHKNILNIFGEYYSHLLSGEGDKSNISGIYNLDKFYSSKDYNKNYTDLYKKGLLNYNEKIINNTIVE